MRGVGEDRRDGAQLPYRELRSLLAVSYGGLAAELAVLDEATMGSELDQSGSTRLLLRRLSAGFDPSFPQTPPRRKPNSPP